MHYSSVSYLESQLVEYGHVIGPGGGERRGSERRPGCRIVYASPP